MEQVNNITKRKKHKHILREDRITIEKMLAAKFEKCEILRAIGCVEKTLDREIERGTWQRLDGATLEYIPTYSADYAQLKHEEKGRNKGPYAKINNAPELRKYLENKIKNEHFSPEMALNKIKEENLQFELEITAKTVYNNIDSGEIGVTRRDLLRKGGWAQDKSKPRKSWHNLKGESIENRPEEANLRQKMGHWEIDLVVGKKGTKHVLLTLTERKTRREIIVRLPNKTKRSVKRALDRLERKYGDKFKEMFKTVTADNGSEFLDFELLEKSVLRDEKRFKMYFAHAYCSWERGTNENANGIIRRFYPKGTDFGKVSLAKLQALEDWMNNYPRGILGGISTNTYEKKLMAA